MREIRQNIILLILWNFYKNLKFHKHKTSQQSFYCRFPIKLFNIAHILRRNQYPLILYLLGTENTIELNGNRSYFKRIAVFNPRYHV